jgi:hypothetical protein
VKKLKQFALLSLVIIISIVMAACDNYTMGQVSAHVGFSHRTTASTRRYLGQETDVGLKSRVRENHKHGSVRGIEQSPHGIKLKLRGENL